MENVTYPNDQCKDISTILETIENRLKERLNGCDDLCNPMLTPLLASRLPETVLCKAVEQTSVTKLRFGFKSSDDPARVYPLQSLTAETAKKRKFHVGPTNPQGDSTWSELPFDDIKVLKELTTYYVTTIDATSAEAERYKRRIVAVYIQFINKKGDEVIRVICSEKSEFYKKINEKYKLKESSGYFEESLEEIKGTINAVVQKYNGTNSKYIMQNEEVIANIILQSDKAQYEGLIPNITYSQIQGQTQSYIGNVSILSTLKIEKGKFPWQGEVWYISFRMPFSVNRTDSDVEFEIETTRNRTSRNLIASSSKNDFSIGIPSFSSKTAGGAGVEIGQLASYTYSKSQTREIEGSRGSANRAMVKYKLPKNAYILDDLAVKLDCEAYSTITLFDQNRTEIYSLSVPTNVPGYKATDVYGLALAIVASI